MSIQCLPAQPVLKKFIEPCQLRINQDTGLQGSRQNLYHRFREKHSVNSLHTGSLESGTTQKICPPLNFQFLKLNVVQAVRKPIDLDQTASTVATVAGLV